MRLIDFVQYGAMSVIVAALVFGKLVPSYVLDRMRDEHRRQLEEAPPAELPAPRAPEPKRVLQVPYDPDYAELGWIEPVFVDEIVGWENEDELEAAGMDRIVEMGSGDTVSWVWNSWKPAPAVEPRPIIERRLRWQTVPD